MPYFKRYDMERENEGLINRLTDILSTQHPEVEKQGYTRYNRGFVPKSHLSIEQRKAEAQIEEDNNILAHKVLDIWAGSWELQCKMWMAPGAPPSESGGTATAAWILGGRFMEMTFKTTMMGQPFEGRAINGYNNLRKTYQGFWVDNMGTAMTVNTGKAAADGKSLTFEGKMDDPMTGKMNNTYRFIERYVSKDEIQQEIHDLSLGKDSKIMETIYKRKK